MKNIQNRSWDEWMGLARRYQKYVLVAVIFLVFAFYAVVVVPDALPKKSKSASSQSARVVWDITTEKPEKIFSDVLQGRARDWYRMGFSTVASRPARIDVILSSAWNEDVPIGFLDIAASDDFQYHEIRFEVPAGMFSDIRFVLRDEDSPESWSYTGVKLSEFALSRLNVYSQAQADRLAPTLAGNIKHTTQMLIPNKQVSDSNSIFESRFVAEADFIENIRLNAKEKSKKSGYVLELHERAKDDPKKTDISVKKVILSPGEFGADLDEWGNQSIAIPARLQRGKEYLVSLTGTGDASRNIVLSPLEGSPGVTSGDENIAAIVFGRYAHVEGGALLSGARVEDFGGEILYSYTLSKGVNDFFDLFDTEGSVKFDAKKKMIAGRQQQRTSFTYRFFTVYPFERFMLSARQEGDTEKEVKLEYSLDNAFWREVPATQANSEPQVFSLVLSGTGDQRTVYVRASYNGEDKKTGSFGLDQLSVRAELIQK